MSRDIDLHVVTTFTAPYWVGILSRRELRSVIAYGRAHELDIADHHDGGWLVRRGWLVVTGRARDILAFCRYFDRACT